MLSQPRKILLTGATSGIGRRLVDRLGDAGHQVVVLGRSQAALAALQAERPSVAVYRCDLSNQQDIEDAIEAVWSDHPDISVLINNAGVQFTPQLHHTDFRYDSIGYETTVNFLAPVWLTSLCLPGLLSHPRGGHVVNISSGLAFYPKTTSAVYCATKAALRSFSQSLRYQLEGGVGVTEVILPIVDTPMTNGRGSKKMPVEQAADQIMRGLKRGRSEIYVGRARLIPPLASIAPWLIRDILRRG
jgi:short-subunit dehydrogenase involved in D-alanine esterification of teichoic acids